MSTTAATPRPNSSDTRFFSHRQLDDLALALALVESDPPRAAELAATLSGVRDANGIPIGDAWGSLVEAWIAIKRGDNERAGALFRDAISVFERSQDGRGHARALNGLGVLLMYRNSFDEALAVLRRGLAIAETEQAQDVAASVVTNLGMVFMELGQWDEALRYFDITSARGIYENVNAAVYLCKRGVVLAELGRLDEAGTTLEKALATARVSNGRITEAEILGALGRLRAAAGNLAGAAEFFDGALSIARELGNDRVVADVGIRKAQAFSDAGGTEEAVATLEEACDAARRGKHRAYLAKGLGQLASLYARTKRWERAFRCSREARLSEKESFSDEVSIQVSFAHRERADAENRAFHDTYDRLARISTIGRSIAAAIDVEGIGTALAAEAGTLLDFDSFGLATVTEDGRALDFCYLVDGGRRIEGTVVPLDNPDSYAGRCAREGTPVVVNDTGREIGESGRGRMLTKGDSGRVEDIRSMIFYPLESQDAVRGVLTFQSATRECFSPVNVEIVKALAAYVAIALENARLFREVRSMAATDPLTGLLNRRAFFERFAVEAERSERYCGKLSVVMADLDHFKAVNDGWGHAAGDAVLKAAASVISGSLRAIDIACRFGGEEFVALLPCTELSGAKIVGERLRAAIEGATIADPEGRGAIPVTASFGVASFGKGESGYDGILARADKALYRAKESGRNRVVTEAERET